MAVTIDVTSTVQSVARALATIHERHVPFAAALAVTNMAYAARDELRRQMPEHLRVRGASGRRFLDLSVRVTQRATKQELRAIVTLDRGPNRRGFLPALTQGGVNRAGPWGPVAVPTRALRPTELTEIPQALYPRALRLLARRDVDGGAMRAYAAGRTRGRVRKGQRLGAFQNDRGKWQILGKERTFALDPRRQRIAANQAGIYQRVGPGRDDIRMLWSYQDAVPLPDLVPAEEVVRTIVATRGVQLMHEALAYALRTAR
jgi:hypothetical protein